MGVNNTFTTAQVASFAGVHKDTILRWLRAGLISEPARDRRGWRIFSKNELQKIVSFAKNSNMPSKETRVAEVPPVYNLHAIDRIDWNFIDAKTTYLTHGIHPYPAKFIPQIPNALIQELSTVGDIVGDIFCGSGTTLVEAQLLKRNAIGIDANPLAVMISRAKLSRLSEADFNALNELSDWSLNLAAQFGDATPQLFGFQTTLDNTIIPNNEKIDFWFDKHVTQELGMILFQIKSLPSMDSQIVASTAFSSIVVSVSKQDSDTRYVRRAKNILPGDVFARFSRALTKTASLLREYLDATEDRFSAKVIASDILSDPNIEVMDLMVCSPPYPNAYSYHLYHQNRMIWLGMDQPKFKRAEIGSHRKYSSKSTNGADISTFRREMEQILNWLRDYLSDNGHACFVVGDSTIKGKKFDNARIIAEAAERLGYKEKRCIVRSIQATKKSFNPNIGNIRNEKILILKKI